MFSLRFTPGFCLLFLLVFPLGCSDSNHESGNSQDSGDESQRLNFGGESNLSPTEELSSPADAELSDTETWESEDTEPEPEEEVDSDSAEEEDTFQDDSEEESTPECAPDEAYCPSSLSCCPLGEGCFSYGCAPTSPPCDGNEVCQDDTYCEEEAGACIPWGQGPQGSANPTCSKSITPGVFFPSLQCEWTGPPEGDANPDHRNVLGSAIAGRLLNSLPEGGGGASGTSGGPVQIAFISYSGTDGGLASGSCCGIIRIIDGKTCQQLQSLDAHAVVGGSNLALGDLDLDGRPEIIAMAEGGGLVAFRYTEETDAFDLFWRSTELDGVTLDTTPGADTNRWSGPSIADVLGDAHPEILIDGALYRWDGILLSNSPGWSGYQQGVFPVVSDADLDGLPDVFFGPKPYIAFEEGDTLVEKSGFVGSLTQGHIALADFGAHSGAAGILPDAAAEVVLVNGGSVYVLDLTGQVIWGPIALPGGGQGGPPTVADFDGDGIPEIAAAGATAYTVFDLDCTGTPLPPECASEGVLWSQASQDQSSNKTGSSVFDFEGDGQAEAVYGDECFLRVYNGTNGNVVFSGPRSSCTWHEMPIIADVDGDYRTEIVIGSNTNCSVSCPTLDPIFDGLRCDDGGQCPSGSCVNQFCRCTTDSDCAEGTLCSPMLTDSEDNQGLVCRAAHTGKLQGIRVYADGKDSWVYSRPIWNQHAYNVANVEDNGTIPPRQSIDTNWTLPGMNHFRQNVQGSALPTLASDLTMEFEEEISCTGESLSVFVSICNRGALPCASGVPFTISAEDISQSYATSQDLPPGECESISIAFPIPPGGIPGSLSGQVDGDESGASSTLECFETNNSATLSSILCP